MFLSYTRRSLFSPAVSGVERARCHDKTTVCPVVPGKETAIGYLQATTPVATSAALVCSCTTVGNIVQGLMFVLVDPVSCTEVESMAMTRTAPQRVSCWLRCMSDAFRVYISQDCGTGGVKKNR